MVEHRAPEDDVRDSYDFRKAQPLTKLDAMIITAAEFQTHDYYMNIGPLFADPVARQLYAEIASIEEQHVTQYESLMDPETPLLGQWLLHEAAEVYCYYACVQSETNPRVKAIWERFLDYELGQLEFVAQLFKQYERRDPAEILPAQLPEPLKFEPQRDFVREVLAREVDLRASGTRFVPLAEESAASRAYRDQLNSSGSPSETVAAGYRWSPGTELRRLVANA